MDRQRRCRRAGTAATMTLAVIALAVAGCGPGKEGGGGGKKGTLNVGLVFPLTGNTAASGKDMQHGWQLWFKQHGDKVAGRKIASTQEDSAGDPTTMLTKARRLVQQKQAKILVGPLLANEAYALAGFLKTTKDVVGITPVSSSDDLSQRKRVKNFIRTGGWQSSTPPHVSGDWAARKGYKRVATLCNDYAFGYESCGGFVDTFTDRGGKVVKQLYAPLGTSDYSSYLAQIDPKSVDAVFVTMVGADAPRFLKAWTDLGLKDKVPLIAAETTVEQSALRGIRGDSPFGIESFGHYAEGRDAPATRDFVDAYKKAYGQLPSYYACATYTAGQWLTEALKKLNGDTSDTQKVIDTLNSVKLDDSCFGPMQLDDHGGTVANVYLRKVGRDQGALVNQVQKTYPNISQFWNYKPDAFLKQPVYSRKYQGKDWPTSCDAFAKDCPLKGG
jgi:branched-chain amino acid transport system substrate-binding protein